MAFISTNQLDEISIYLGINRLQGETDSLLLDRIKRFSKVRYTTTPVDMIRSIVLQCGLRTENLLKIYNKNPYTINIYNGICEVTLFNETNRYFKFPILSTDSFLILSNFGFDITINTNIPEETFNKNILLENKNFGYKSFIIDNKRTNIDCFGIVPGSILSKSTMMGNRVNSILDIKNSGDYYFDDEIKYLELSSDNVNPFELQILEYSNTFYIEKTPINIIGLNRLLENGINDNFINVLGKLLKERGIS